MSTGMPARSITFSAPMWAMPFAPPPLSTTATFFLIPDVPLPTRLSCAAMPTKASAANMINAILFISF